MSIVTIPNHLVATVAWLRTIPEITAIVPAANITAKRSKVGSRTWGIVPSAVGGSTSRDVPLMQPRVDVRLFGPTEHDVARLYEVVHPAFIPYDRRSYGFRAEGCQVSHIWHEGGPTELIDDDDGQTPMILLTYRYQMLARVVV